MSRRKSSAQVVFYPACSVCLSLHKEAVVLKEYQARIDELLKQYLGGSTANIQWQTPAEGKLHIKNITNLQKELRLLKKEVQMQKQQVRAEYADARAGLQGRTNTGRVLGGGIGKFLRQSASNKRVDLRKDELSDMNKLDSTIRGIDSVIMQLDQAKLQIEQRTAALGR
jgi:phage host-nuclease inhibitor protein Gam